MNPMVDPRFAKTMFLIEANSYERMCLWRENHQRVRWEENMSGICLQIGKFGDMPICVSLVWATINGRLVCFYDAVSEVAHSQMIEDWLATQCDAKWDNGTRRAHCDAMNFGHCLSAIDEANQ